MDRDKEQFLNCQKFLYAGIACILGCSGDIFLARKIVQSNMAGYLLFTVLAPESSFHGMIAIIA